LAERVPSNRLFFVRQEGYCRTTSNKAHCLENFDTDFAVVSLFYAKLNSFIFMEAPEYTVSSRGPPSRCTNRSGGRLYRVVFRLKIENILADVGGVTGLLLGFSVITVVETVLSIVSFLLFFSSKTSLIEG
jgi:Amiloride-sensitive sodium channel